jgi:prephenate dehydrogenase
MRKLAVIGPGLLGGSIALALQRRPGWQTAVWARRPEAVAELQRLKIAAHASTDLAEVAADADLVILCVPIGAMPDVAEKLAQIVPAKAIVTDVGSVKVPVVSRLAPLFHARGRFIGSHPMAGSDQAGLKAARADLFSDSVCIVTPQETDLEVIGTVTRFWEELGCQVRILSPAEHDEIVSLISHLPHLVAAALVNTVARHRPEAFEFIGPGFRDTTRVAGGPVEMWTEILGSNRAALRNSAEALIENLREFITLLDRASPADELRMNEFLQQAKAGRDRLRPPSAT